MIKMVVAVFCLVCLAACVGSHEEQSRETTLAHGYEIAEAKCGACHAVGRLGDSPAPEAPAFRTLSGHYRVATLEQALGEGISTGHPAMPEFQFQPHDVRALIAYLQSIQDTGAGQGDPH